MIKTTNLHLTVTSCRIEIFKYHSLHLLFQIDGQSFPPRQGSSSFNETSGEESKQCVYLSFPSNAFQLFSQQCQYTGCCKSSASLDTQDKMYIKVFPSTSPTFFCVICAQPITNQIVYFYDGIRNMHPIHPVNWPPACQNISKNKV